MKFSYEAKEKMIGNYRRMLRRTRSPLRAIAAMLDLVRNEMYYEYELLIMRGNDDKAEANFVLGQYCLANDLFQVLEMEILEIEKKSR